MNTVLTLRSIDDVASVIASLPHRSVVGIAGAPGSGKSSVAASVVTALNGTRFNESAIVLPMDGFHLLQSRLIELGRRERMGAPDTFDVEAFVAVLAEVRARPFRNDGKTVLAPGFDRVNERPVPDAIAISPSFRKVIVEGNYLLLETGGWERVAPLLDATFFVEVDHGIRMQRLIERHIRYGKTPDAAAAWANGPDERNAELIARTAARADYLIAID